MNQAIKKGRTENKENVLDLNRDPLQAHTEKAYKTFVKTKQDPTIAA